MSVSINHRWNVGYWNPWFGEWPREPTEQSVPLTSEITATLIDILKDVRHNLRGHSRSLSSPPKTYIVCMWTCLVRLNLDKICIQWCARHLEYSHEMEHSHCRHYGAGVQAGNINSFNVKPSKPPSQQRRLLTSCCVNCVDMIKGYHFLLPHRCKTNNSSGV